MHRFGKLFANNAAAARRCRVIGMVHVDALPGTPLYTGNFQQTIDKALQETEIYLNAGIDSILIENMHDIPYIQAKDIGPEITAAMTRICSEIKQIATNSLPLGLQILAGGNKQALAVAKAANFDFIRAEGFVFGHLADEGYTDACAGDLLRYRKQIDAEDVLVFTDIKKKHSSHAMTSDVSLVETAKAAEFFLTDGVILTGTATGDPASPKELQALQEGCSVPVLVGSGVTFDNFKEYSTADACIIGSYFKSNGRWQNALDGDRIKQFMNLVHQ